MDNKCVTVAMTGASGSIYGIRLIEELLSSGIHVSLVLSDAASLVIKEETSMDWASEEHIKDHFKRKSGLSYFSNKNFFSPLASGSSCPSTMVIAPCSMGTLGRIAGGISSNLIERAADVVLKEKGKLILLPRETPMNDIHLENMLKLSRMDAVIVPAMPGFYHNPKTIDDLINFVVGKLLDQIGIEHNLFKRWGEK